MYSVDFASLYYEMVQKRKMSARKVVVGYLVEEDIAHLVGTSINSIKELDNTELLPKKITSGSKADQIKLLKDVEILIAHPFLVLDLLKDLPKTCKWVQFTWAGLDNIMPSIKIQDVNYSFITTRMGGCYSELMKEYVLGAIISLERNLKMQITAPKWLHDEIYYQPCRTLDQLTVGILGAGDIGMEIAAFLKKNGVKIHAFKKNPLPKGVEYPIDQLFLSDDLDGLLATCDYICNVLPSTKETVGLLSGDRMKICSKRKPGFINIGRGDVIDDISLLNALNQGWISSAFLDVFNEEPLPLNSPFWRMPNVVVTPHVSSRFPKEMIEKTFKENLLLYLNDKPLKYVFNWQTGY